LRSAPPACASAPAKLAGSDPVAGYTEMAVRELSALKRGTVRLGVGPTTLTYRLPQVLADYKRRFPEIELIVLSGNTEFLLGAMQSQNLDLAVVMESDVVPKGLIITPLGSEELVVVLNQDHPLARKTALEPADLAALRFILYEKNTAMQSLIDRYFELLEITPRITMEVENNEAIKSLVRSGLGASILPLCAVADEPPDSQLRVLRVKGKRLLRQSFALYLAPAVIEKMLSSNKPPALGGETRNVTVYFSDIADFSSIAEKIPPTELVAAMNEYLSAMTDVIEAHGGFVDKYFGDAIVAVFGAPLGDPDHATNAVHAALRCAASLGTLDRVKAALGAVSQRIGLNSGEALVGNIGSRRRFIPGLRNG